MTDNSTYSTDAASTEGPVIKRIGLADLWDALARGWSDFKAMPTHAFFLAIIYPVIGLVLIRYALGTHVLSLIFPLVMGFALLGPVAAIGIYELSKKREAGEKVSWRDALAVIRSPSLGSIVILGLFLIAIFVAWIWSAQGLYVYYIADEAPDQLQVFLNQILYTSEGHQLILVGNIVGFFFALLVFVITVVSFPMFIDRKTGTAEAVVISLRVVLNNFFTMMVWAAVIAGLLILGALPALLGLVVIIPVLGHATWHIYRKTVAF